MILGPQMRMEDLLGELGGEQEEERQELDVERSPGLDAICKSFEALLGNPEHKVTLNEINGSWEIEADFLPTGYRAKDVEQFSLSLSNYQFRNDFHKYIGAYLSALANSCPDKEVVIHTSHLHDPINYLGKELEKDRTLIICGSAGGFVGANLFGGKIIVKGDAGLSVGCYMSGGEIVVEGDVGELLGFEMFEGVMRIEGEYKSHGSTQGGDIYHKGIQIVKGGEVVG